MAEVALYARVSKADDSQDPEVQLRQLRRYAQEQGLEAHDEYVDRASGADPFRPELERMVNDARARRFGLILAVKLDRVARSLPNFYDLLRELELYKVQIHCVDQPEVSTRTSTGRFMTAIIGAAAEYERELIRERTLAGLAKARASGKVLGRPKAAVNAERVLELRREGKTVREVAEELKVSVGTVHRRSKNGASIAPSETPSNLHVPKSSD